MLEMAVAKYPKHPVRKRIAQAATSDARRVRLAAIVQPADWQEHHSPTESVLVRLTGQKKMTIARRRKTDARLWEAMSGFQQEAALEISDTFEGITAGTAPKIQNLERTGGKAGHPASTAHIEETEAYWRWAESVQRAGLSHAAVVDILIIGESCRTVDASRHKRKGWAMENLLACLNLYCQLQGWPQH